MENQKEIWKDIEGYEGRYKISNLGRVKSFSGLKEKILSNVLKPKGYFGIILFLNGKTKSKLIHRLVAESFLGKSNLDINHKDGNNSNNNIENLEYMSRRDIVISSNKSRKYSSKYTGVTWNKEHSKWRSQIRLNGKLKNLGNFDTELEAHNAYLKTGKENGIKSKYS